MESKNIDSDSLKDELFFQKLRDIILQNVEDESFSVSALASEIGLSRSQLHRKIRKLNNKSVSLFIREVRLDYAAELLLADAASVSEIAYKAGFNSPTYFSKCFHEYTGMTPSQYNENRKKIKLNASNDDRTDSKLEVHSKLNRSKNNRESALFFSKSRLRILLSIMGGVILLSVFIRYAHGFLHKNEFLPPSIAVLPFKNLSELKDNQHFADGIMDGIINKLSYVNELHVISRTSSETFRNTNLSSPEISAKLKVNYLIEGSVQRYSDRVRIIIQLIDAGKDDHIWSEQYDREWKDIFDIQTEIANQVTSILSAKITLSEHKRLDERPTAIMTAYDYYLKAKELYQNYIIRWDERDLEIAIQFYNKALEHDSNLAEAYTGLAEAFLGGRFYGKNNYGASENWKDSALILCNKALGINPNLSDAYKIQGMVYRARGQNEEFFASFKKAVELNPNHSDSYELLSSLADFDKEFKQSITYRLKALELDPLNPIRYVNVSVSLRNLYLTDLAIKYDNRALELQPDCVQAWEALGVAQLEKEHYKEALVSFQKELSYNEVDLWGIIHIIETQLRLGNFEEAKKFYEYNLSVINSPQYTITAFTPNHPEHLGYILWNSGNKEESINQFQKALEKEGKQAASKLFLTGSNYYYNQAAILAILGRKKEAYEFLKKAMETKGVPFSLGWTLNDPLFAGIKNEERFIKMMNDYKTMLEEISKNITNSNIQLYQFVAE